MADFGLLGYFAGSSDSFELDYGNIVFTDGDTFSIRRTSDDVEVYGFNINDYAGLSITNLVATANSIPFGNAQIPDDTYYLLLSNAQGANTWLLRSTDFDISGGNYINSDIRNQQTLNGFTRLDAPFDTFAPLVLKHTLWDSDFQWGTISDYTLFYFVVNGPHFACSADILTSTIDAFGFVTTTINIPIGTQVGPISAFNSGAGFTFIYGLSSDGSVLSFIVTGTSMVQDGSTGQEVNSL